MPASEVENSKSHFMDIRAARQSLLQSMEKAKEIGKALQKSGEKLHQIEKTRTNLDSIMTPLLSQSKESELLTQCVDRTLEPTLDILQVLQSIREMEIVLMDDPQKDLKNYLRTLSDLEQQLYSTEKSYPTMVEFLKETIHVAGHSRVSDTYKMLRLNETLQGLEMDQERFMKQGSGSMDLALEKLETVFKSILVANSVPKDLHDESYEEGEEQESSVQNLGFVGIVNLQTIAEWFKYYGRAQKCLKMYWEIRIDILRESFKSMDPYYLRYNSSSTIDKLQWADLEGHVAEWLMVLKKTVKVLVSSERKLCSKIFENFDSDIWTECFGKLVSGSGISALIEFGEAVSLSQTEPQKLFKLLDMIEGLEGLKGDFESVFQGHGCLEIRVRLRELKKQLVHSACLVIWDFAEQVKGDSGLSIDGSAPKLTSYVVNYLKYLVTEYATVMTQVLKMENNTSLVEAVVHVLNALELNLETRSKGYNEPALAHVFLMNNYWYIFKRARDSELGTLLSEAWLKQRRRLVTQHVLGYEKDEWGPVLMHLNKAGMVVSSGGRGGARDLFKQRLRAFNTAFQKVYETHRSWVISDEELREGTFVKIVQALVPAYRNYTETFGHLVDQTVSGNRYFRYTPEQLEDMLADLFSEKSNKGIPSGARRRAGSNNGPEREIGAHQTSVRDTVNNSMGRFCHSSTSILDSSRVVLPGF
eukprot:Gb_25723 [translate_table: standard]